MTAILSRDLPADGETFDSVEAVCPLVPEVDRNPGGGPVAAVVLTACGGERHDSGTEAKGKSRAAVAADRATAARDAVWDDIRTAVTAGDFEPPRFIAADSLLGPCEVGAVVRAGTKPDPEAVAEVVTELKDRGWRTDRPGDSHPAARAVRGSRLNAGRRVGGTASVTRAHAGGAAPGRRLAPLVRRNAGTRTGTGQRRPTDQTHRAVPAARNEVPPKWRREAPDRHSSTLRTLSKTRNDFPDKHTELLNAMNRQGFLTLRRCPTWRSWVVLLNMGQGTWSWMATTRSAVRTRWWKSAPSASTG